MNQQPKRPPRKRGRNSVCPGVYKHFKGNIYHILAVSQDTESGELVVVYIPQRGRYKGKVSHRKLKMFKEIVRHHKERPEYVGPRFTLLEEMSFIREGGMTPQKILEVLKTYESEFQKLSAKPEEYSHEKFLSAYGNYEALSHCYSMLEKMRGFIKEGRIEKVFRWLGFVQGVLWAKGAYKLEELMQHNRPDATE